MGKGRVEKERDGMGRDGKGLTEEGFVEWIGRRAGSCTAGKVEC